MTTSTDTPRNAVARPSQNARSARTVRLRLLMEEAQRLEIAARIKQLRERSPYTQPIMADKLGLRLRSYQRLEERGTTKWERCEEIAEIHKVHPRWVWDGSEQGPPPDVLGELSQSDAVRKAVGQLQQTLEEMRVELLAAIGEVRSVQEAQASTQRAAGRRGESAES